MIYTGNKDLDHIFERDKIRFILLYGGPGSGKTNLIFKILKESVSKGYSVAYVSTEGTVHLNRLFNIIDDKFLDKIFIATPSSLSELLKIIIKLFGYDINIIAIDSINYLYRIEALTSFRANEMFLSINALTFLLSENMRRDVIFSAQVRESDEGVEPSGIDLIQFYDPYMIRVKKVYEDVREIFLEREKKSFRFKISHDDIIWI